MPGPVITPSPTIATPSGLDEGSSWYPVSALVVPALAVGLGAALFAPRGRVAAGARRAAASPIVTYAAAAVLANGMCTLFVPPCVVLSRKHKRVEKGILSCNVVG